MTTANAGSSVLHQLLETLAVEAELLEALVGLGRAQRQALIESAFLSLESVNEQMMAVAQSLVPLEQDRLAATRSLGIETLTEAVELAAAAGLDGFDRARARLVSAAADFQRCQEQNASLVLAAMKTRERWLNFVAGMVAPTYGAGGSHTVRQQHHAVSRSA